jgi:hypothetical protein
MTQHNISHILPHHAFSLGVAMMMARAADVLQSPVAEFTVFTLPLFREQVHHLWTHTTISVTFELQHVILITLITFLTCRIFPLSPHSPDKPTDKPTLH